jgi:streptomycin 6-kinase
VPTTFRLPRGLEWWAQLPAGAEWLDRLPRLVAECAEAWALRLGPPFEAAARSYVAPAVFPDGAQAVLKIGFPELQSK